MSLLTPSSAINVKRVNHVNRLKRLVAATLVVCGCAILAKRYHAVDRILHPREDIPTVTLNKQPFVRRVTADGYLRAVKSTPLTAPMQAQDAQKIAWMVPDGSKVVKGEVVIRFDPSEFEKKLRDGEADRASANAKIDKEHVLADSAMRGRALTADLSSAELKATRAFPNTDPEIFSRNQIIESAIDEGLSTSRMNHAGEAKSIETTLSKSKVDLITVEKKKADLHVTQAQQGLQSLEVRAPHDGIVVFEQDWRGNLPHVGDSVWAGQTIASLPLLDDMEAEVFVLEADAAGLALGNVASVVLEAHPDPPYDAKIKRIDTLAKPRIRDVPIQYFGATLELSRTERELMKPGERVHATLILDKRDALTVPRQSVFDKDGKTVVYRLRNGGPHQFEFDPVEVKLGASSPGLVVIEEGPVTSGDKIALRDPTRPVDSKAPASGAAKPSDKAQTTSLSSGGGAAE